MIRFACPGCGAVFTVGDEKAGKTGKCPKCAAQFEIPAPLPAAPPPPPPPVDVFAPRTTSPPPPTQATPPPLPPPPTVAAVVELPCPHCRGQLAVNASDLGTSVECPYCKKVFAATRPGAAPLPPASPATSKPQRTLDDVLGGVSKRRTENDEDRPSRRGRSRAEDEDDRPSRRRRGFQDDEEDDRPSRRRRDDEDDDRPRQRRGDRDDPTGMIVGIISLVCGILAIPMACCCGLFSLPLDFAAIGLGAFGLTRSSGRGLSIAGIICGVAALLLFVIALVFGLGANIVQQIQQKQVQQQPQNPPFGPPFR